MPERSWLLGRLTFRNRACKHAEKEETFCEISKSLGCKDLCLVYDVAARGLDLQLITLRLYFSAHDFAAVHWNPRFSDLARWEEDSSVLWISLNQLNCDSTLAAEANIITHNLMHNFERSLVSDQAHLYTMAIKRSALSEINKDYDWKSLWYLAVEVVVFV